MKGKITLFFTALCFGLTGCIAPPKGLEKSDSQLIPIARFLLRI